jgi:dCMP deaminase
MIIGLTGKNASGKGTAAEYLKRKGFNYYSLSDVIREELQIRGMDITRENLIRVGNELRSTFGPSVLAQRIIERLENDKNYVIDSIRNRFEVEALRKKDNFVLLSICAKEEIRFERIVKRNRGGDPIGFEEFLNMERMEDSQDNEKQQLSQCENMADYTISNEGSIESFHRKIDEILIKVLMSSKRPGWDEYFINIAKVVSLRSNCMKRKVGAIIVKDKRVLTTGYNGTPRGTKNCNEGGCPRCNSLVDQGKRLDECLCSHAEENAITQAAFHGISVKDSTLYTTYAPCLICAKMIINAGIKEIVYNMEYVLNEASFKLFKEAGIKFRNHSIK